METKDGQARSWEEGPDLLQSAWRYKWLIAVAALLGLLLGYGWAARQPTLYQAASQVLLTGTPTISLSGTPPQPVGDPERYLRNQATLIGTTDVLELAAKRSKGEATVEDLRAAMVVEPEQDADLMTISILDGSAQGGDARQRHRLRIRELRRGAASPAGQPAPRQPRGTGGEVGPGQHGAGRRTERHQPGSTTRCPCR